MIDSPVAGFSFQSLKFESVRTLADEALAQNGLAALINLRGTNTAADAPYHNAYHADCMIVQCAEALHFYERLGQKLDATALLVAAFFHDFDHTMGAESDRVNMFIASGAAANWLAEQLPHERSLVAKAIALIRATEYPFSVEDPTFLEARILRDADLMQVFEDDDAKRFQQYDGLRREIERARGRMISRDEFASGMRDWWRANTRWLSDWGAARAINLDFPRRCDEIVQAMSARDHESG